MTLAVAVGALVAAGVFLLSRRGTLRLVLGFVLLGFAGKLGLEALLLPLVVLVVLVIIVVILNIYSLQCNFNRVLISRLQPFLLCSSPHACSASPES